MSAGPATNDDSRRAAFATYVVPEIDVLLRVAHTLVPRPGDAEDLVQDTLLRAFAAIESFDGRHPRAWLLTIMRNTQINRTRRRRPQLLDDPDYRMDRLVDEDNHLTKSIHLHQLMTIARALGSWWQKQPPACFSTPSKARSGAASFVYSDTTRIASGCSP